MVLDNKCIDQHVLIVINLVLSNSIGSIVTNRYVTLEAETTVASLGGLLPHTRASVRVWPRPQRRLPPVEDFRRTRGLLSKITMLE